MRIAVTRSANGAIVAAALALGGCITTGTPTVSLTDAEGATIIFESIDGPPRPVSTRLSRSLDQEAAARKLVVVTRGGQALYHIRAYLAAHTEAGITSLAWAFDVYDAQRKRAFRLNGEERAVGAAAWAAANDAMLQRIASTSITQLMTFIATDRTPGAAAAAPSGPALADMTDGFRPEAAGGVRALAAAPAPAADHDAPPAPGPGPGQRARPPLLAYSVSTSGPILTFAPHFRGRFCEC